MENKIICGDALEEIKKLEENSVDAIITDPPYGLEFMGKEWDSFKKGERKSFVKGGGDVTEKTDDAYMRINKTANRPSALTFSELHQMQNFFYKFGIEAIKVLKPGAFMLVFGGTRTYHRMTCGIEDAGFEIRDCILWIYGSGFPKSLNIGKQIDKIQGNKREKIETPNTRDRTKHQASTIITSQDIKGWKDSKGNSEWEGWGTALKPACEPIVVARKPLSEKNVALNVLKWGTGGINIDESRIKGQTPYRRPDEKAFVPEIDHKWGSITKRTEYDNQQGRFPANIILDEESAKMLDEQSGESRSGDKSSLRKPFGGMTTGIFDSQETFRNEFGDKGGASRFFYVAKASKSERNFGLDDFEEKEGATNFIGAPKCKKCDGWIDEIRKKNRPKSACYCEKPEPFYPEREKKLKNNHPTVKPIKLMEYLIKLVTRENALVLDPFIGSGTTAIACIKLNRQFIGIEKEEEYVKIANARIKPFLSQTKLREVLI